MILGQFSQSSIPDVPPAPVAKPATPKGPRISYPKNGFPALTLPDGEHRIVKSVLNVDRKLVYGDYVWNDDGVPQGKVWVRVDLGKQLLSVFRDGHEIGSTVIIYGADSKETPIGVFPVLAKDENYWSKSYDQAMPYMLQLTRDVVAIHAAGVRDGAATHGCIGVPAEFARLLFGQVKVGDIVAVTAADQAAAKPV